MQQRSDSKRAWGGFWSNSCCGHPGLGEGREEAAKRRPKQELGIDVGNIAEIEPYRYRFEHNNVVENEICPIFAGTTDDVVSPAKSEVKSFKWLSWSDLLNDMKENKALYSPWSQEQVAILCKSKNFKNWLGKNAIHLLGLN